MISLVRSPPTPCRGDLGPHMACIAAGFCVVQLMATNACTHGRDDGDHGHGIQIRNRAVAGLTLHADFQIFAVAPLHARQERV
jgi:hypothetical protein